MLPSTSARPGWPRRAARTPNPSSTSPIAARIGSTARFSSRFRSTDDRPTAPVGSRETATSRTGLTTSTGTSAATSATDSPKPIRPSSSGSSATCTLRIRPVSAISGSKAWGRKNGPLNCTRTISSNCSSVVSTNGVKTPVPALLIR